MNADKVFNIFSGLLAVAMVTVLVTKPNTSQVINALGGSFSGAMKTAMGN